jgi:hypothetical protein
VASDSSLTAVYDLNSIADSYHGQIVQDTNGYIYVLVNNVNDQPKVMRNVFGGTGAWSVIDGANGPSTTRDKHAVAWVAWESGGETKIGVVTAGASYASGMNTVFDVEYHEFHCSDVATTGDTWDTVDDTIDTPVISTGRGTSYQARSVGIVRRTSDFAVVYRGDDRASMGADYQTAWYARGTAASWTAARLDSQTSTTGVFRPHAVPSHVGGQAHLLYTVSITPYGRTLDASNSLSSETQLQSASGSSSGIGPPYLTIEGGEHRIAQLDATSGGTGGVTNWRIFFYQEDASDDLTVHGSAGTTVIDAFDNVTEVAGTHRPIGIFHDANGALVWAVWWEEGSPGSILAISVADNDTQTVGSWDDTATEIDNSSSVPEVTINSFALGGVYDVSGTIYLGILINEDADNTASFWRYELAAGGLAITPAVPSVSITAGRLTITTGSVPITPAVASVSATPASLTVTQASPIDPVGASVGVTPSTLVVTPGSVGVTPAPLTVSVTPSTVVLTTTVDVTLVAASVSATPSTVAVTTETPLALTGQSVAITPGTLDVVGAQAVDPAGASVSISARGLVLTTQTPITLAAQAVTVTPGSVVLDQNVVLTGASVSVTPDSLTVTTGAVNITPTAPTVTITPGTLDVTAALSVSLVGQTVTVTPSTLEVDTAITPATAAVIVTAGGLTVAQSVTLPAPVVAVTPGTVDVTVGAAPVDPVGQTVNVSAGSMAVTVGAVDITPAPVTVSVTPSTLAVTTETAVTPAPVTVNVTAGSLELDHGINIGGQTVNASPSTLVVAAGLPLEPTGQTVTVTSGTMTVTTGSVNISLDAATVAVTPSTVQVANAGEEEAGMLMMMGIGT